MFAEVKCCLQYTWFSHCPNQKLFRPGDAISFSWKSLEWVGTVSWYTHNFYFPVGLRGTGAQGHKPGSSNLAVWWCILGGFFPCLLDPTDQILSKIWCLVHYGTFFLHSKYVKRKVTLSILHTAQLNIIIVIRVRSVGGILHGLNAFREMTEDVWKLKHLQGQRTQQTACTEIWKTWCSPRFWFHLQQYF